MPMMSITIITNTPTVTGKSVQVSVAELVSVSVLWYRYVLTIPIVSMIID
jgi:hypothetical protein